MFLEKFFILKRIMELRKRHRTGVEPAVDNVLFAHESSAALTLERTIVDIRAVKFYVAINMAKVFKFLFTADNVDFTALVTNPYGKRRAPVPFAGNTPVDNVFKEVTHSTGLYGFGHPVYRIVGCKKPVFYRRRLYKPTLSGIIDKRCVATPTERITMGKFHSLKE